MVIQLGGWSLPLVQFSTSSEIVRRSNILTLTTAHCQWALLTAHNKNLHSRLKTALMTKKLHWCSCTQMQLANKKDETRTEMISSTWASGVFNPTRDTVKVWELYATNDTTVLLEPIVNTTSSKNIKSPNLQLRTSGIANNMPMIGCLSRVPFNVFDADKGCFQPFPPNICGIVLFFLSTLRRLIIAVGDSCGP